MKPFRFQFQSTYHRINPLNRYWTFLGDMRLLRPNIVNALLPSTISLIGSIAGGFGHALLTALVEALVMVLDVGG